MGPISQIHDPWADKDEVMHEYGLESLKSYT